jgi:hypothetical protein
VRSQSPHLLAIEYIPLSALKGNTAASSKKAGFAKLFDASATMWVLIWRSQGNFVLAAAVVQLDGSVFIWHMPDWFSTACCLYGARSKSEHALYRTALYTRICHRPGLAPRGLAPRPGLSLACCPNPNCACCFLPRLRFGEFDNWQKQALAFGPSSYSQLPTPNNPQSPKPRAQSSKSPKAQSPNKK